MYVFSFRAFLLLFLPLVPHFHPFSRIYFHLAISVGRVVVGGHSVVYFLLVACKSLEYIEIGICRCNMHISMCGCSPACLCLCVCRNIFARIVLRGAEVLTAELNRLWSERKWKFLLRCVVEATQIRFGCVCVYVCVSVCVSVCCDDNQCKMQTNATKRDLNFNPGTLQMSLYHIGAEAWRKWQNRVNTTVTQQWQSHKKQCILTEVSAEQTK